MYGDIAVEVADKLQLSSLLRACLIFAFKNRRDISPKILAQIQKLSQSLGNTEIDILDYARDDIDYLPDGRLSVKLTDGNYVIYQSLLKKIMQKNISWYQPALELFVEDSFPLEDAVRKQMDKCTNKEVTLRLRQGGIVKTFMGGYATEENLDVLLKHSISSVTAPVNISSEAELTKLAQLLNNPQMESLNLDNSLYRCEIASKFFIFSCF